MDEVVLLLIFACILIFVIIIFPRLTKSDETVNAIPITKMGPSSNSVNTMPMEQRPLTAVMHKNNPQQVSIYEKTNTQSQKNESNSLLNQMDPLSANIMLDSYYITARDVPEDYPLKKIGDCPYTKAPSTDLPIANMPMCGINKAKDTRLRATSFL